MSSRRLRGAGVFERQLHQQFGFRARDQHLRRDFERQSVEFARADDIGDRLAAAPALDQRRQRARLVGAELAFGLG